MSFKLVDDKGSSLSKANAKRRLDDLLSESIPPNEYIVNRSGKYCCRICPHWPIFDTLAVLISHREGKKHKANFEIWDKAKMKKELDKFAEISFGPRPKTAELQSEEPTLFDDETDNLNKRTAAEGGCSKCKSRREKILATNDVKRRKKVTPFFQMDRDYACSCYCSERASKRFLPTSASHEFHQEVSHPINKIGCNIQSVQNLLNRKTDKLSRKKKRTKEAAKKELPSTLITGGNEVSLMLYYSKMKQNGWIIHPDGKWIRDGECEFDSDEEPPKFEEVLKWNK